MLGQILQQSLMRFRLRVSRNGCLEVARLLVDHLMLRQHLDDPVNASSTSRSIARGVVPLHLAAS
ncbi:MAG: hypothetical protein R3D67_08705 [Hyphomicrobiaceae bacterium]